MTPARRILELHRQIWQLRLHISGIRLMTLDLRGEQEQQLWREFANRLEDESTKKQAELRELQAKTDVA